MITLLFQNVFHISTKVFSNQLNKRQVSIVSPYPIQSESRPMGHIVTKGQRVFIEQQQYFSWIIPSGNVQLLLQSRLKLSAYTDVNFQNTKYSAAITLQTRVHLLYYTATPQPFHIRRATLLLNAGGSLWVPDALVILCQVTSAKLCRTMKGAGQKNNGPKTHTRTRTHKHRQRERTRSRIWALASICIKRRKRRQHPAVLKRPDFFIRRSLSTSLYRVP